MEALSKLERMRQIALKLDDISKKIFNESLELSPLERALLNELVQQKIIDLYEEALKKKLLVLPKRSRGGQKGARYKSKGVFTCDKYQQVCNDVNEETDNFYIEKTKLFINDLCEEMRIEFGYSDMHSFKYALESGYSHYFVDFCDDGYYENEGDEYPPFWEHSV